MTRKYIFLECDEQLESYKPFIEILRDHIGKCIRSISINNTKEELIEWIKEENK